MKDYKEVIKDQAILGRKDWLDTMLRIAGPVLEHLEKGTLKSSLPLGFHSDRLRFAPLEAFGRTALGIAPWLELKGLAGEEAFLQQEYRRKMLVCIDHATDRTCPDYMEFGSGGQPLVDTAFLAHALVRAPKALIGGMDQRVKEQVITAFKVSRSIVPGYNNWLLFAAMVETGLFLLGAKDFDRVRIDYAIRSFENWYKGDGMYGDGEEFHWDYYNSFVIQPMYVDILRTMGKELPDYGKDHLDKVTRRAARYASILERLIAPDGTYPVIGRSIAYRFGAFQLLSQMALQHTLEKHISPAQVRCGLSTVMGRIMSFGDMFDENGWLRPGVCGYQPELAEGYINTGSLYLCMAVFLPLGLGTKDSFWSAPDEDWTSRRVWGGGHIGIDHAI